MVTYLGTLSTDPVPVLLTVLARIAARRGYSLRLPLSVSNPTMDVTILEFFDVLEACERRTVASSSASDLLSVVVPWEGLWRGEVGDTASTGTSAFTPTEDPDGADVLLEPWGDGETSSSTIADKPAPW